MRHITNAQLAANARLAYLEGRLGAPKGMGGQCKWADGTVCAVGASGVFSLIDATYQNGDYMASLVESHDNWAYSLFSGVYGSVTKEEAKAKFLALLDLHDPVRALEREAQAGVGAIEVVVEEKEDVL